MNNDNETISTDVVWFCHNPSRYAEDVLRNARRNLEQIGLSVSKMQSETVRKIYEQQIGRAMGSLDGALSRMDRNDRQHSNKLRPRYDSATPTIVGLSPDRVTDEQICIALDTMSAAMDVYCKRGAPQELYLGPFFKNFLNDEFADMDNDSRKAVISRMEELELVRVEQRQYEDGDGEFAVLIPNQERITQYENDLDDKSINTEPL